MEDSCLDKSNISEMGRSILIIINKLQLDKRELMYYLDYRKTLRAAVHKTINHLDKRPKEKRDRAIVKVSFSNYCLCKIFNFKYFIHLNFDKIRE